MQQLETKFYSRAEIAEELELNINDSKHFKRNLENKLVKWGYSFEYSRKGVLITRAPETANEKLAEILIREYDLDIQIDTYAFACFITAFEEIEIFESMPWGEREKAMKYAYGVTVTDRTLRNWANKLFKTGTLAKSNETTCWRTRFIGGEPFREWVNGIEEMEQEMSDAFAFRKKAANDYISNAVASGRKDYKEIRAEAWKVANSLVWKEYGCCYYTCKTIKPGAFDKTKHLQEIYELVREIAANGEETFLKVDVSLATGNKKEFIF